MNNGVTTMENALRMVSDNIETYYKAGAPNGSWCISTCLNAASQFETMRAELQQLRHSQPTNEPLTLKPDDLKKAYAEVKEQCDYIRSVAEKRPLSKSAQVVKSFDLALYALRDLISRDNPQPLTLEELRGMDGEPKKRACLIDKYSGEYHDFGHCSECETINLDDGNTNYCCGCGVAFSTDK